jgi:hypothetical protein
MTRVKHRDWTAEEITLIKDTQYGARELSIMLNARFGTIRNLRVKLGVVPSRSATKSKPRPSRVKSETRYCLNSKCAKAFQVKPAMTKKYCSIACSTTVNNPAPKGKGSRPYRVKDTTPEYARYAQLVHNLSHKIYLENINMINPNKHPRTVCGVEGGYQLDHIIPIKECYNKGLSAEQAASLENLRMLPWRDNLMRNYT